MSDDAARPTSLTYRDAGVDIDTGNALIDRIKPFAAATRRAEVLAGLGGFGALFQVPLDRYKNPVLVAGTDGVGTKLKLALEMGKHDTIGIDLVAMCVNDLIVQGAESLFFLDYYATGKLNNDVASDVIKGIGEGCLQAGCSLIGGETAEMPGMYAVGDYDLAGFAVGIVERDEVIDGSKVADGDVVLGLASSGPHSNGYSLVRRILQHSGRPLSDALDGRTLGEALLAPTRIYVKNLLALIAAQPVHALAHITGGGLLENIPRVLPDKLAVELDKQAWTWPAVFQWLQEAGNVTEEEMQRTFNCGIGMVVVVPANAADAATAQLEAAGETVYRLGRVIPRAGESAVRFIN